MSELENNTPPPPATFHACSYVTKEQWTVVLEKTLESPLDAKEIKPLKTLKEINSEYSLEGLMLKLQYLIT